MSEKGTQTIRAVVDGRHLNRGRPNCGMRAGCGWRRWLRCKSANDSGSPAVSPPSQGLSGLLCVALGSAAHATTMIRHICVALCATLALPIVYLLTMEDPIHRVATTAAAVAKMRDMPAAKVEAFLRAFSRLEQGKFEGGPEKKMT